MKTLKILTLIVMISLTTTACALEYEGGVRLLVVTPTGAFGDAVDDEGGGLEINFGLRPSPTLSFGLGANAMMYGSESRTYSLPLVEDFDLTTDNNLAGCFFYTQWRPLQGAVQPYVEARAGVAYLWTESQLEDEDWWDGDEVARKTNYDDFTTFWGGSGGLLLRLSSGNSEEKKPGVFLDLKVNHVQGGEAEYLTEGDVSIVDDVPVYDPSRSETDMTTYQLGVVLTF